MKKLILSLLCICSLTSSCVFGAAAAMPEIGKSKITLKDVHLMNPIQEKRFVENFGHYIDAYQYFSTLADYPKAGLNRKSLKAVKVAEHIKNRQADFNNHLAMLVQKVKGLEGLRGLGEKLATRIVENKADIQSIVQGDMMEAKKGNLKELWHDMRRFEKDLKSFRHHNNRMVLHAIAKQINAQPAEQHSGDDLESADEDNQE